MQDSEVNQRRRARGVLAAVGEHALYDASNSRYAEEHGCKQPQPCHLPRGLLDAATK